MIVLSVYCIFYFRNAVFFVFSHPVFLLTARERHTSDTFLLLSFSHTISVVLDFFVILSQHGGAS